jgi:hypothetical protein
LNLLGSISWNIFLFPTVLNQTSITQNRQQYFGLDLIEEGTERTFWTHKPSVWQVVFTSVLELAKSDPGIAINNMFNGILACPVRAIPNGPNQTQTFQSVKGQNIQHWIMLVPMPVDAEHSKYIPNFISKFQDLCKKPFIRSAYKTAVVEITQHFGLINQVSEDGNYWNVIENASQKDLIFNRKDCLSEVLLDFTIKEIVFLMFGVKKDPTTWTDSVKKLLLETKLLCLK